MRQPRRESPEMARYLAKVERWAYKVTDDDVASLLAVGYTQEEIYAATMETALTAGIERFQVGVRVLREATSNPAAKTEVG